MHPTAFNEAVKIWERLIREVTDEEIKMEIDIRKKLVNFFQVGECYYYIFNLKTFEFDFISPEIEKVLGYSQSEVTAKFLFQKLHPEDQAWYTNFENETIKFLLGIPADKIPKYKVRVDFRVQKKNGEYIRILHQVITIQQYTTGSLFRTLGVHTDITHIKPHGKPTLSYIGLEGEPSYINVQIGEQLIPIKDPLTGREKEILALIIEGKKNTEIARLLNISKQTVDTHRKNMILKNGFTHSGELIAEAIKNGWI
jgi:DNA-binding CsgD family transcriptional regulator